MVFEVAFIWVAIVEMLCQVVQGITGFGATVLGAPFITALLGTQTGGPYGTLISHIPLIGMAIPCFKKVSWKDLVKVIVVCGPFEAVGAYWGYKVPSVVTQIVIGFAVTLIACINIYKIFIKDALLRRQGRTVDEGLSNSVANKVFQYACLVIGGLVNGAYSVGGPLITVYALNSIEDKEKFRNTMVWVWVIMNSILVIPQQIIGGLYTPRLLSCIVVTLPLSILGVFAGMKLMKHLNKDLFLKIVYVLLLIVGGNMFIRALLAL